MDGTTWWQKLWAWALANPELVSTLCSLLVGWVVENIRRRPPPDPPVGWRMAVWRAREHVMVLPWNTIFGQLKLPFRVVPELANPPAAEPPPSPPEVGSLASGA